MLRFLVLAALFFVLSPGNFLTLPRGGSKRVVALTHAVVFVVAYYLSEKVAEMFMVEGFQYDYKFRLPKVANWWGGRMTTVEREKYTWNALAQQCQDAKNMKDEEYRKNGDKTALFRELDKAQGFECDQANEARNRLRNLGVSF